MQDDGYAGTLKSKRKGNDAGELGRTGNAFVPMQVGWHRVGGRVCSFHPASCWQQQRDVSILQLQTTFQRVLPPAMHFTPTSYRSKAPCLFWQEGASCGGRA